MAHAGRLRILGCERARNKKLRRLNRRPHPLFGRVGLQACGRRPRRLLSMRWKCGSWRTRADLEVYPTFRSSTCERAKQPTRIGSPP